MFTVFDPETVMLLGNVLERAAEELPREQRSQERKVRLASNILSAAAAGERNPGRLQAAALALGGQEPSGYLPLA
jgi:hypothetical protein